MTSVEEWFVANTGSWEDHALAELVELKAVSGHRVSLVVPARNEGATVGDVVTKVREIPGAKPAGGKSNAAIFEPGVFVDVRDELIGLLGELTATVSQ